MREFDYSRRGRDDDFADRGDRDWDNRAGERDAMNDSGHENGRDEDVEIMWPSAVPPQPKPEPVQLNHSKSISGEGRQNLYQQDQSSSGMERFNKQPNRQPAQQYNRNAQHTASLEEEEDNYLGTQQDFNNRDDSSGFERDINKRDSNPNRWMR